ncbi:peptidoglycan bridge formation glycyltransferase FemA/FemB family protein [Proteinivorax tanatarense]|uniref:Peptidoglycan bridge formation glycyltransferase FemA/FemB family protein n=1 Tax=Proteinivorax tanatarense TaxID=1260629 RepID=A0AAU7VNP7_9FIRM
MPILELENEEEVKRYESFIENSNHGHMMQSVYWSLVKNNWDRDYIFLENDEGDIEAALSILSIKNDGKNAFMYAPRGPVCDFKDISLVKKLIEEAKKVAKRRNGFFLRMDPEVRYSDKIIDEYRSRGFIIRSREQNNEKSFSNPRNNMVLDITDQSIDDVMAGFTSKQRNKIRKTYKRGLSTQMISTDDEKFVTALNTFYNLTEIMAKRQGISYRPRDYFERLFKAFKTAKIFETKDKDNEVLSSCIIITYNKKCFYIYSASSNNKRNYNASTQMNYEAIKYAVSKNMEEYDFGGVYGLDTSDALYAFKYSFCGHSGHKELIGELDVVFNQKLYNDFIKD